MAGGHRMSEPDKTATQMVAASKKSPGGARATATKAAKKTPAKAPAKAVAPPPEPTEAELLEQLSPGAAEEAEYAGKEVFPTDIHGCIVRLMKGIGAVRKTRRNEQGSGYDFRGVDDVVNAASPGLKALGCTITPKVVDKDKGWAEVGNNRSWMGWAEVTMAYTITAPDKSQVVWEAPGFAFDSGDKAMSKACSVAYRTAFLQGLCLPTDSRDPDQDTYHVSQRDDGDTAPVNAGKAAQARAEWEAQQREARAATPEPQEPTNQAQAGEEDQTRAPDLNEARTEMWRLARDIGWQWHSLVNRFKSDHDGKEPSQTDAATVQAFTNELLKEAEQEEDAKRLVESELGGKEVESFPESKPGSERLI